MHTIFVYIVSVMNLSRRQATMISSEIGESFERSVAASRRWCTLIVAEDCLFIIVKAERALKTAAALKVSRLFGNIKGGKGWAPRRDRGLGARMLACFPFSRGDG